jgi:hypothetical protein
MYSTIGTLERKFESKQELIGACKENDLMVCVLRSNPLTEWLDYFEIEEYLEKRYRAGVYIRLVKRNNKTFYCKGYNS